MFARALCILLVFAALVEPQSGPDPAAVSRRAMNLLLAGRYSDLEEMFTAEMRSQLTDEVLRGQIGPQIRALGTAEKPGEPAIEAAGSATVAVIRVKFSSATIDWRFTVNPDGKIAGLFFQPGEQAAGDEWQRPSYSRPSAFHERDLTVGDGSWRLPGTLTIPNSSGGAVPGVVLVHGSGPLDRDETVGANKPFRDLAEGLASRGIAVLRYEKRTKVYASRMGGLKDLTVQQETVEDGVKAAALLRQQPEVASRRVFVLGHSLGGYVAPRIAQQDSRLAGLILLAANVRPLDDLLTDQLQWMGLAGAELEKAKTNILRALPATYTNDLNSYNPAEESRNLTLPMLILQGERDYQVTMKDFNLWKAALAGRWNMTFRSYPALNHLFIAGQGKSVPSEYTQPGHVDADVIDQIAGWIARAR
jgi:dienelactone hydrolase